MRPTTTAALIALLLSSLVGCDGSQSITTPDAETVLIVENGWTDTASSSFCPSVEEMCAIIAASVENDCPDDGFRNYGQLHSCRKQAVDEYMRTLPDCYSGIEQLILKKCVMVAVGLTDSVDKPTRHTNPRPTPHVQ